MLQTSYKVDREPRPPVPRSSFTKFLSNGAGDDGSANPVKAVQFRVPTEVESVNLSPTNRLCSRLNSL